VSTETARSSISARNRKIPEGFALRAGRTPKLHRSVAEQSLHGESAESRKSGCRQNPGETA